MIIYHVVFLHVDRTDPGNCSNETYLDTWEIDECSGSCYQGWGKEKLDIFPFRGPPFRYRFVNPYLFLVKLCQVYGHLGACSTSVLVLLSLLAHESCYICQAETKIQVNLCQKHLFLDQLTHNMTKDCSLIYQFNT